MARQIIDVESPIPNTTPQRYGEPPKTAFEKVNAMTDELYTGMALAGNVSTEPPADPVLGQFWGDLSVTPAMVRRWDGTQWIAIQPLFATLGSSAYRDSIGTAPLYGRDSVLGTVGALPDGTPTGALIQTGSNSNGMFWRYTGGMQVTQSVVLPFVYTNSLQLSISHNFPTSFNTSSADPVPSIMLFGSMAGIPFSAPFTQRVSTFTASNIVVNLVGASGTFSAGNTASAIIRTVGRWHI